MTPEPRIRVIDLNELELMSKMGAFALKSHLIECLIPDLSSPDKTRELLSEVYNHGCHGSNFEMNYESIKEKIINNLIKD